MGIRGYRSADLGGHYAIALQTGHAGTDASALYADARMMGHIYAGPYARLEPGLALVVEEGGSVGGFIVGALDTRTWEDKLAHEWWPMLRRLYADPDPSQRDRWTADQRRAFMIHHPSRTPDSVSEAYPAHLHVNLLPRLRRRGIGPQLLDAWRDIAEGRCTGAIHVGVNRANTGAVRFCQRQGFALLPLSNAAASRTLWFGQTCGEPCARSGHGEPER